MRQQNAASSLSSTHSHSSLETLTLNTDLSISKTCLYIFDPLKSHFYIVKLGFTGVFIIFLISAQNIDCGYSLDEAVLTSTHNLFWAESWKYHRLDEAVLTSTHNLCFEQNPEKYQKFLSENFHFLVVKFSVYLNRHVFVMGRMVWSEGIPIYLDQPVIRPELSLGFWPLSC